MPSRGAVALAGGSTCLVAAAAAGTILLRRRARSTRRREHPSRSSCAPPPPPAPARSAYEFLIGSTPLVELTKLSALLGDGRTVLVKMECHNPGGTGKDRAALRMIQDAERRGDLPAPLDARCCASSAASAAAAACAAAGGGGGAGANTTAATANGERNSNNDNDEPTSRSIDSSISLAVSRSRTGGIVVEGTSGSTGISLASLCAVRGHSAIVVMPDDQAEEKRTTLRCLGAVVHVVPNAAISNPNHYVNVARRIADEINSRYDDANKEARAEAKRKGVRNEIRRIRASFIDQFENPSNFAAHYEGTGPELWSQLTSSGGCGGGGGGRRRRGTIDAFVMSSGTGGTISGVGRYLKERDPSTRVVLVDPPGSALYNKVKFGVAYASQQSERSLLRHRYDTIAEGIGLDRVTANFARGTDGGGGGVGGNGGSSCGAGSSGDGDGGGMKRTIDDAVRVTDQEAVDMAHWLLREEGLFVGSSSAMNVVGAVRVASELGRGASVITVICDGGQRHLTRFWNRNFVVGEWGLEWPGDCKGGQEEERRVPDCIASILAGKEDDR